MSVKWRRPAAVDSRQPGEPSPVSNPRSGMTLVEVMVAFFLFTLLAAAALTAVIQSRKMAEDNVAQAIARTVAQGIIEQVRLNLGLVKAITLREPVVDPAPSVPCSPLSIPMRFTKLSDDGTDFAAITQRNIPMHVDTDANANDWFDVGALDPAVPSSVLGVLLDVEYRDAANAVIRPARYMKMQVNLKRLANDPVQNYVAVVLSYRWQPPARNATSGTTTWVTREIRTIIPYTDTF